MASIPSENAFLKEMEEKVSEEILSLVLLSEEPAIDEDFITEYLHPACKKLEEMICYKTPVVLVNEVTNHLVTFVLKTYKNLEDSYCRNERKKEIKKRSKCYVQVKNVYTSFNRQNLLCKKRVMSCREIALEVGSAVFHPSTTQLEYCTVNIAKGCSFFPFMNLYLGRLLKKGGKLKKLTLGKQLSRSTILDNLPNLKKLESFSFYKANNTILKLLYCSCRNLKHLTVSNSINVTDDAVKYITNMRCLRSLEVDGTGITDNGFTQIIKGIPYAQSFFDGLLSLRARLTPTHLDILVDKFPNLNNLEIHLTELCDISILKKLENLQNLNLYVDGEVYKISGTQTLPTYSPSQKCYS